MNRKNTEKYVDLGHIVSVLWKYIVLILIVGFVFGALFFFYAQLFVTPMYEANALFYVNNSTLSLSSAVRISTGELNAASDLVDTYVAILQSRANMELVIEESGVNYSYEKLRGMVSAKPEEARSLANTIAVILPDKISDIVANSSVEVVDYAVTPHSRVSPSYYKYSAVGLLLGIVLCSALVLLRDYFDDVIHNEDYLLENFDAPILATIPDLFAKTPKKYGYYGSGSAPANKGGGE